MYKQNRYDHNTPQNRSKERFHSDLMYKQVVYVYPVTIARGTLGGDSKTWNVTPTPVNASVQMGALNGQATDPSTAPNRIAHIYTRKRNSIRWNDKIIWNDVSMKVEYVEDKFENNSGTFQYTYARCLLLSEKDFVDGTPAVNKGH